MGEARGVDVVWMGTVDYERACAIQRELVALRAAGEIDDRLLLLEHPPTITLGRGADPRHVLEPPEELAARGVVVCETDRGGDVTYHGPGQLVGYPIVLLREATRDLHRYLRTIEGALIQALERFDVEGRRFPPHTGVWVEDRKIAAIGVKASRWVTSHGFALNVEPGLEGFAWIVPCGIREYGVTSLSAVTGRAIRVSDVVPHIADVFQEAFGPLEAHVESQSHQSAD